MTDYQTTLGLYQVAVDTAGFDLKGKNNRYTSHNGHMFSFLGKDGVLAVRLSKDGKKAFNDKHNTEDVIQYNSVMNGYVEVIEEIMNDNDKIAELIMEGFEFVDSLKPK